MEKKDFHVGLVGWGLYLPEKYITAEELSPQINIPVNIIKEKMGFCRKPLGGPEDHCVAMGIKATQQCLEKTGVDPLDIDLIIWAGEDYNEYVCWTASIAVQEAIGATKAWAFDSALRCAGTPLALKLAKDLMFANPEINTVLIAGGNTNCYLIDYRRPEQSFMFDMAPSGLAMILKRDWLENEVLESHIITESSMCNDVMSVKGGTKNPLTEEDVRTESWRINVTDPEGMKHRLGALSLPAFTGAVRGALKRSNLTEKDVAWVCPVHINPKAHKAILADLGLTEEQGAYLYNYGHCGHGDQLIGLEMGLTNGKVQAGAVVVFLGAVTLFLDEIGDMPYAMQAKLLRVLQEREFERVGGKEIIRTNVRVVSATNADLESLVQSGGFRRDLFYRLNVLSLKIAPLRDRREDIPNLVYHFLGQIYQENGCYATISQECLEALARYSWPGNIRELRNVVEKITLEAEGRVSRLEDMPAYIRRNLSTANVITDNSKGLRALLAQVEADSIRQALEQCGGCKTQAAAWLQIPKMRLYRKIKQFGISSGKD